MKFTALIWEHPEALILAVVKNVHDKNQGKYLHFKNQVILKHCRDAS